MRNLTDEQAAYTAYDVVRSHLEVGIEYIDIVEGVDEHQSDESGDEATDEDYRLVANNVELILDKLLEYLVDL